VGNVSPSDCNLDPDPVSFSLVGQIFQPFQPEWFFPLGLLVLLLLCSALISGSEVAFFSLSSKKLHLLQETNPQLADALNELLEKPKQLLATILISNNFVNVGIVILSAYTTGEMLNLAAFPLLGFLIQIVGITFLILLFGEVLPKIYATRNNLALALFMRRPMYALRFVFRPVSELLTRSTEWIERSAGKQDENLSVDELSHALELTNTEHTSTQEQKILEGIVKFGGTTVRQIMKPRTDMVCLDTEWNFGQVHEVILESGYSRMPVFEEKLDHIKGVLYIKDLIPHIDAEATFEWQPLIREAFFVPENKKIDDLLKEFQDRKIHLAIVVDEFGGTSGLWRTLSKRL